MVSIKKNLKRVWESYSKNPTEVYEDGMGSGFLGEYEEAIEFFDRVDYLILRVNDIKKSALFYKAVALGELGKHEEAITAYKKNLKWDKEDERILTNIGFEYAELNKFEEAIQYYDKSIKIDPKNADVWSNKADALLGLERFKEALVCANKSLKIDPEFMGALENKSHALSNLGKNDEAIEISKKIIELEPEEYANWEVLGIQYRLINNLEKSLESFNESQKYDLTVGSVWYNKACVLSGLDRKEESLDALFIAISIEPENLVDLKDDEDLKNIHSTERFQKLLSLSV